MNKSHKSLALIGVGGIGSWLMPYLLKLTDYQIIVFDGDRVEASNCTRQIYDEEAIGMYKADYWALEYPGRVIARPEFIGEETNVPDVDVVISCVDNHTARWWVQEKFYNTWQISAGNNEDNSGMVFNWRPEGHKITHWFPEIGPSEGEDRSKMTCGEIAELEGGEQLSIANINCAVIALQLLLNEEQDTCRIYFDQYERVKR